MILIMITFTGFLAIWSCLVMQSSIYEFHEPSRKISRTLAQAYDRWVWHGKGCGSYKKMVQQKMYKKMILFYFCICVILFCVACICVSYYYYFFRLFILMRLFTKMHGEYLIVFRYRNRKLSYWFDFFDMKCL